MTESVRDDFFVVAPEKPDDTDDIHNTSAGHIIPVAKKGALEALD